MDEITKRWSAQGHDVTWFCGAAKGLRTDDLRGTVHIRREGNSLSLYRKGLRFAESEKWDAVIESINTRPFFAPQFLHNQRTISVFHQLAREVWFHDTPLPIALVGRFIAEPIWLRRYRGHSAIAVSESTKKDLLNAGLHDIRIVHNGVSLPKSLPDIRKADVPTFAFLGRLQPSKRPDHAVEAFKIVRARIPDARLWIIGDGPMRERLQKMNTPGVTIFGRVDEDRKWNLLSQSHLLLMPSVREGWGIAVIEAAAMKTPSVGYNVPGLVDSIQDGRTGWLCDPNPQAMAALVLNVLDRADIVGSCAASAAQSFNWTTTAAEILRDVIT